MLTLMRDGGVPMWFILLFGAMGLLAAGRFALRPEARVRGFIHWMLAATVFSALNGTFADLGAVFSYLSRARPAEVTPILIEGLAESMSPGVLGFALAALIAMLTAVGRARLDARAA